MRIACLQFAPQVGDIDNNLNRADAVLSRANPEDLDILVLPELAFSGYNFKSLNDISPFLEPTGAGITSLWARTTALKYNCVVAAGYPEKVDIRPQWPTSPEYYNSVIVVNQDGETIVNYRKTHLYYTDETWALEGPRGFFKGYIPGVGRTAIGICMDINPYRFESPWSSFEFAFHVLDAAANVVVLSMAWLTREDARHFSRMPKEPDMETLTYWIKRLEPLIRAESDDEIIVVFANRTGLEDDVVYAGTSAVIGIRHGEVNVYGLLGRGEKELLVVDTSLPPFAKLVYRPEGETASVEHETENPEVSPTEPAVNTAQPESPASSAASKSSQALESTPSISISGMDQDHPKETSRRIFGGHVLITHDALTPMTGTFPSTPFEESPVSPRYFEGPLESRPPRSGMTQSPTWSTGSNHPDASTDTTLASQDMEAAASVCTPRNNTNEQSAEFSELIDTLHRTTLYQPERDGDLGRPSSPKSRNASRTGREERSDSVLSKRPPSAFGNRPQSVVMGQQAIMFRPESPKSRNTSRNQSRNRSVAPFEARTDFSNHHRPERSSSNARHRPTPLDFHGENSTSVSVQRVTGESAIADDEPDPRSSIPIDLEKIGADLLVFEEGERRPRRDSLECHADEDDFIVMHASSRHGRDKPINAEDAERPASQANGIVQAAGSSGLSKGSPCRARTSSKPQSSPALPVSRAISRGRQRDARASDSPLQSHHQSPKPSFNPKAKRPSSRNPKNSPLEKHGSPVVVAEDTRRLGNSSSRKGYEKRAPGPIKTGNPRTSSGIVNTRSSHGDSRKASEHYETGYSVSTITVATTLVPTTPEDIPPTPKAMVLDPDWDKGLPLTVSPIEAISFGETRIGRPKSAVW